jgi:hypothetical protein
VKWVVQVNTDYLEAVGLEVLSNPVGLPGGMKLRALPKWFGHCAEAAWMEEGTR